MAVCADVSAETSDGQGTVGSLIPDVRGDESELTFEKRNWVVVPIPVSNPTLDTGLVVGGAYFHRQTEEQEAVQPPSVTGAAGFYSSNDSKAFGIANQSYLKEDKWRIGGLLGHADIRLDLRVPSVGGSGGSIDWSVRGEVLAASVSRRVAGQWYVGGIARYVDMTQEFGTDTVSSEFNTDEETRSIGLGFNIEYDSRDKPINSYSGERFKLRALVNSRGLGSDSSYGTYRLSYASYHLLRPSLVLAWEAQACSKSKEAPLWDACRIDLRGFSATDYLGQSSASGQIEARWQFHRKWGAVAFAGSGYYKGAFSEIRERKPIPSYGLGIRFMVLESQRINLRLDYGRSTDSDAVYFSVGEAF